MIHTIQKFKWLAFLLILPLLSACGESINKEKNHALLTQIEAYSNPDENLSTKDARSQSIRSSLDIDIYAGSRRIYFEWDERGLDVENITIKNHKNQQIHTLKRRANKIQHHWNWYTSQMLESNSTYPYTLTLTLKNGERKIEHFEVRTRVQNQNKPFSLNGFHIYDDIEGGSGDKASYLKDATSSHTLKEFGLRKSHMYWVDWFYEPKPDIKDSQSRLDAAPNLTKLQSLIQNDLYNKIPHNKIEKKSSIIVLDIEHVPTKIEYVTREFSPYGSFASQFLQTTAVKENGRKIVSYAIANKLLAIYAVKQLLPDTAVGLWGSIVPWNRLNNNKKNRDYNALAKGVENHWRINYPTWHHNDSMIFKEMLSVVDYVMPVAYPMFDLSNKKGREKQKGFILSKLMEIKRLNPDTMVIPSICPQYTEGWARPYGLYRASLSQETFTWYLNLLYDYYQDGLIDSLHIWADNSHTKFTSFVKQGWWKALHEFTKNHQIH